MSKKRPANDSAPDSAARWAVRFAGVLASLVMLVGQGPLSSAAAPWQWPVEPAQVVHEFEPPDNPYGSGHRGVDLAVTVGQAVVAPAAGRVTFAGVIAGRGVVVVSHGDVRTTYEPVDGAVTVGAVVSAGDLIATVQPFGFHCSSPCLHWGARRGDEYLDPTSFVVVKPSRLLPLWGDGSGGSAAGSTFEQGAGTGSALGGGQGDGAVGPTDRAVVPGGLMNSPGVGVLMGSRAGAGALTYDRYSDRTDGPAEVGVARADGRASSQGAAATATVGETPIANELALLVIVASGALLVGGVQRRVRSRLCRARDTAALMPTA